MKERGFQTHTLTAAEVGETKLLVRRAGIEVKVEINIVMRGTDTQRVRCTDAEGA